MTRYRPGTAHSVLALALALAVTPVGSACSSRHNDVAFGQGGDRTTGGSANEGGAAAAGRSAGGAGQAASPAAGASGIAGASVDGGSAGGTSLGGAPGGLAGSPGEAGAAALGGAGSAGCDEGCLELCEGGSCMCSCPTTTLKCPNTAQTIEAPFPSACKLDDDCFGAEHFVGCCRVSVVGLNTSQREGFTAWERDTCHSPPVCGCAVDVLITDDGKMIGREMTYVARCVAGKCVTSSP